MRDAREADIWPGLIKRFSGLPPDKVIADGITFDVAMPCAVIGGRNGAGKSRVLRALADELGERAVHIDVPTVCEQSLSVLRGLTDVEDLKEAVGVMPMSAARREDLERIIGRDYEEIDWYGLDLVPGDDAIADAFTWGSDQPVTPYFEATYRTRAYTGATMGLGEFSTHLLFWILQQYDHNEDLVILIDEPDAYLPPDAAAGLLARLLNICQEHRNRGWRLIIATHSPDIIAEAIDRDAFIYIDVDADGTTTATHSSEDPSVADVLLARPPMRRMFFVEDESAWHLTNALVARLGREVHASTAIIWCQGAGNLKALGDHLPRPARPRLDYAFVFDGDQRDNPDIPPNDDKRWPAVFLPTDQDPDTLLASVRDPDALAPRLGQTPEAIARVLRTLEGSDAHDRVNKLGEHFGRELVLPALAAIWVETHTQEADTFQRSVQEALPPRRRTRRA